LPFVDKSNVIILANHGTVSWGDTVEQAYCNTEVLDAYCRMLMLAKSLGRVNYFTEPEARALLELKGQFGMKDPRNELQNCDICANDVFRNSWKEVGVEQNAFQPPRFNAPQPSPAACNGQATAGDQEQLIQTITDRVMAALSGRR